MRNECRSRKRSEKKGKGKERFLTQLRSQPDGASCGNECVVLGGGVEESEM
jgi:hypothetical protein